MNNPSTFEVDASIPNSDAIAKKIAHYQRGIKYSAVVLAMICACICVVLPIEFVYAFPLLVLVAFAGRMWSKSSWPVVVVTAVIIYPLAYISNSASVEFFAFVGGSVVAGVCSGWLYEKASLQRTQVWKMTLFLTSVLLLLGGCAVHFWYQGNPVSYLRTLQSAQDYISKNYHGRDEVAFRFKNVRVGKRLSTAEPTVTYAIVKPYFDSSVNYSDRKEFVLYVPKEGDITDCYQRDILEQEFNRERTAVVAPFLLSAVGFEEVSINAWFNSADGDNSSLREEYLNYYSEIKSLSTELKKGKQRAENETDISVYWDVPVYEHRVFTEAGARYIDDTYYMSKEDFIEKASAMHKVLSDYQVPFKEVLIKAGLDTGYQAHVGQAVTFKKGDSLDAMIAGYTAL